MGIREVADEVWLVSFMDYGLGFFDQEKMSYLTDRLQIIPGT